MPVPIIDTDRIVITASRAPESEARTAASVTIIDRQLIVRVDEPVISALLRLTPSAAIATSGPAGSLTEIRIRGAEANHTLLFVDGIKIDDPASGDTPRFEILNADLASRIEVVRGPQSALWGSEAVGGVIAVNGVSDSPGYAQSRGRRVRPVPHQRLGRGGDTVRRRRRPGFPARHGNQQRCRSRATRTAIAISRGGCAPPGTRATMSRSEPPGLALAARTEFDGFDLFTGGPCRHARQQPQSPREPGGSGLRSAAMRRPGARGRRARCSARRTGIYLADVAAEPNARDAAAIFGSARTGLRDWRRVPSPDIAGETEQRNFLPAIRPSTGWTNQVRTRSHESITAEWRGDAKTIAGDVAVRRDLFNRFRDATSVRASLLGQIGGGFSLAGSYAEGIAQPTFFDLYGFFPGNFVGNPDLKPESSRGFELSLRYRRGPFGASLTGYRQRLRDEIVNNANFTSVLNAPGRSRRSGLEAAIDWKARGQAADVGQLCLSQGDAAQRCDRRVATETRRPKHSGSIALDGATGRFTYGASLAYVGKHLDNRDTFPFDRIALGSYWLADARIAYAVRPGIELFARGANLLDQRYQDVFSYRTEGRAVYAGALSR